MLCCFRRIPPEATGIPVLFIPGNAGSHRQVRSMSSVALKMAETKKTDFHFSYFAIDFNEEFSALSGAILQKHTEFTHECLKEIFGLYNMQPDPPKTVVLEGHSMGGIVARALFTLEDFDPTWVHTIITKAAPHQAPVMNLDATMAEQYDKVNNYWRLHGNDSLKHVTVFSSGGGFRDRLVRSGLTSLDGTMAVPRGWVSVDHQCHVWCKQVVMATIRALFDAVDRNTKQLAVSPVYRMNVFRHHFDTNAGSIHYKPTVSEVKVNPSAKLQPLTSSSTQFVQKVTKTGHFSFDVKSNWDKNFVAISNIMTESWLVGCPNGQVNCSSAANLASKAFVVPPLYSNKKVVHLSSQELARYHSLIAVVPGPQSKDYLTQLTTEFFLLTDRNIQYTVTNLLMFLRGITRGLYHEDVVIPETTPKAVFYNISLDGLDIPLQAYTAHLTILQCTEDSKIGALMKFHVPWSKEHTYRTLRADESGIVDLKLQSGKPNTSTTNAQLHLYLDPACRYRLTISISWTELLGQNHSLEVLHRLSTGNITVAPHIGLGTNLVTARSQFSVHACRWAIVGVEISQINTRFIVF
ncbi:GPI inositol-deacylase [Lamellibrachia satsuma]|nr:GPI inositol-deacylase [Lamellibrachia satsuma]